MRGGSRRADGPTSDRNVILGYVSDLHRVAVLAHDGIAPFELGVAAEVFALPRPELGAPWCYSFALCAQRPGRLCALGGFGLVAPHGSTSSPPRTP